MKTSDEEETKQIVIINLKDARYGLSKNDIVNLIDQAIGKSKKYSIFNTPEGLLIEKKILR